MRALRRLLLWIPRLVVFHFYYRAGIQFGAADHALKRCSMRTDPFSPIEPTDAEWNVICTGRRLGRLTKIIHGIGGRPIPRHLWWDVSQSGARKIIWDAVFKR
jgi:hypothetical protein